VAQHEAVLKARDFLFYCEEHAIAALEPGRVPPHRKLMWTILQLHFGEPAVHFELQPQPSRRIVEVGLHFEGPAEKNDAWAAALSRNAAGLLGELGPEWELEAWTASWRRLHRVFPIQALTASFAREIAAEFARAIAILGPIVEGGLPQPGSSRGEHPLTTPALVHG
jgi:hypothetical protein